MDLELERKTVSKSMKTINFFGVAIGKVESSVGSFTNLVANLDDAPKRDLLSTALISSNSTADF